MNIWFKLSPDEATDFQVPWNIAKKDQNRFYSTSKLTNLYHDGPWLLLSFEGNQARPEVAKFQSCTVEFKFINEFESFNPLSEESGGKLLLNRHEIGGLVELLTAYADQLPAGYGLLRNTFEPIDQKQWQNFHIYLDQATASRQRVFLQACDPLIDLRDDSIVTMMIVTLPPKGKVFRGHQRISTTQYEITFRQFSLKALNDPNFSPMNQGVSSIDLDRNGFLDLAMLLEELVEDSDEFPFGRSWESERPFVAPALNNTKMVPAYCLA
ncbi:MAG: hypothetical protein GY943_09505 [Chloroflexi bacterium]|nr:hypothetical protein [Chloroflexota bacterium]